MTEDTTLILAALRDFAHNVTAKAGGVLIGEPEDQLRSPIEIFLQNVGKALGHEIIIAGEVPLPGRLGQPDYAILVDGLLAGYIELKAPGKGANPKHYKGHDHRQWKRFKALPNIIYSDGNEWALYRSGQLVRSIVHLSGDITSDGKGAVRKNDAEALKPLLTDFLAWEPSLPPKINAQQLAQLLAPLCRLLRNDVADALKDPASPLVDLAQDWRQLLFPDASDERFADSYAQTVTFALLLARSEGVEELSLENAVKGLSASHTLLSRALEVLTDPQAQREIAASLQLLQRIIGCVPTEAMKSDKEDPWLYFYEDFLAAYDPTLRKDAGAYYTPVEVVHAQVRLIDNLLTTQLGKTYGFADKDVVTLDPAVGTGTYLLGIVDHALDCIEREEGKGSVQGRATQLAGNIYGFENMVGPYAVAELRLSRSLDDHGAQLSKEGLGVYLTDTLESPFTKPVQLPLFLQPIAEQHKKALHVKDNVPVIVCLGNPPYDRHPAADETNKARTGGWVRWGEKGDGTDAIFNDFTQPAKEAGHGGDLKNAYNLYVYFWRWALWKVYEHKSATGLGIVSFITASSYLDGDAFVGMREHMRRHCNEIWIIDLGGEGRGPRKSDNIFAIQTPVAIAIASRTGALNKDVPAKTHYTRIEGDRKEKLAKLETIHSFENLVWENCPSDWQAPFRPAGRGAYFDLPLLTDLMPWQQSGVKVGRTWPIAPDLKMLEARWQRLCQAERQEKDILFVNRPTGRKVTDPAKMLPPKDGRHIPLTETSQDEPLPPVSRYSYRSFDRQYMIADGRLIDRPSPPLWQSHSDQQIYLTTLSTNPLGAGPALTVAANVPDLHHFRGSFGAKDTIPFFRDSDAEHPNITSGLLNIVSRALGISVGPEDFIAYLYGVLAHPS
ncbi:MAG: N-6 DNA methylase, partial [Desulfobacteraceae bacterium]|nr:N-6 DNA methylase [Desulfobacteraceae bacterium]